jgi:hypothetical protein
VTLTFVGACLIAWNKANTIDKKIDNATVGLRVMVKEIQGALVDLQAQNNELIDVINRIKKCEALSDTVAANDDSDFHEPIPPKLKISKGFLEKKLAPYDQTYRR